MRVRQCYWVVGRWTTVKGDTFTGFVSQYPHRSLSEAVDYLDSVRETNRGNDATYTLVASRRRPL